MTDVPKIIILVSGYMKSGKDMFGKVALTFDFRRFAFADALKDEASKIFSIPRALMDTHDGKETFIDDLGVNRESMLFRILTQDERVQGHLDLTQSNITVRHILISYGNFMRRKNPRHWANAVANEISISKYPFIVITDWRYPNEFDTMEEAFTQCHVTSVRIHRFPRVVGMDFTETLLDDWEFDHVIDNTGSLEDFMERIKEYFYRRIDEKIKHG